jgi:elongation factor P--(R)-beta-lysine ligase
MSFKEYPPAPEQVLYAGRITKISAQGSFLVLTTEKNQVLSEYSLENQSHWLESLKPGDIIAVDAQEKLHLLARGEEVGSPVSYKTLRDWQKFLQLVRDFFVKNEFLEINTPTLVVCPGTEPSLEAFQTTLVKGTQIEKRFLPTSPELHLKKAMVYGFDKIFEIKNCFRNGEFTEHHQPEFWMLEWYRGYVNLKSIEQDVRSLISYVISNFPDETLKWPQSFRIVTVAELFKEHTGFAITPWTTLEEYKNLAKNLQIEVRGADSIDDYFFAIFIEKIESSFSPTELVFVKDYPPFQAALARVNKLGWAERMEVYFGGFELANAFHELNDPEVQAQRFEEDLQKKKALGKSDIQLDSEFMSLLKKGMPPSAGIALGLDRLFMALFEIHDIRQTKLFPY